MSEHLDAFRGLVATAIAIAIAGAVIYAMANRPEKICVQSEKKTLPLYAQGPKHHIKGPLVGYVEKDFCIQWDVKPVDGNKPFVWPAPVY